MQHAPPSATATATATSAPVEMAVVVDEDDGSGDDDEPPQEPDEEEEEEEDEDGEDEDDDVGNGDGGGDGDDVQDVEAGAGGGGVESQVEVVSEPQTPTQSQNMEGQGTSKSHTGVQQSDVSKSQTDVPESQNEVPESSNKGVSAVIETPIEMEEEAESHNQSESESASESASESISEDESRRGGLHGGSEEEEEEDGSLNLAERISLELAERLSLQLMERHRYDDRKMTLSEVLVTFMIERNFYWVHLLYILFMALLGGLIIWSFEDDIWYLDALFIATSAICVNGLTTVDVAKLKLGSQIMLVIWIQLGGIALMSSAPLILRLLNHMRKDISDEDMGPQTYRIIKLFIATITSYVIVIQLIGFIIMGAYLDSGGEATRIMRDNGVTNAWWFSLFLAVSSFQNSGFCLFSTSLAPYSNNVLICMVTACLAIAGDTLFPLFLRLVFMAMRKITRDDIRQEDIRELLLHPRSYYYLLFPATGTWALLGYWLMMTTTQWLIFFVEWDRVSVYVSNFSAGTKLMDNFVQTIFFRTCGLSVVNIGNLNSGHLVFLLAYMFLSSFPYMITLRTSSESRRFETAKNRFGKFAKILLARDLIWLYVAIVTITFLEGTRTSTNIFQSPNSFLRICFEVVSAFGTIGLSMGFPGLIGVSYCATFCGVSKFIIMLTCIAGRHRGLPETFDTAVSAVGRRQQRQLTASMSSAAMTEGGGE